MLDHSSFATSVDFIFICFHEINSSSLVTCNWFPHCLKSRLGILSNSFVKNTLFYLSQIYILVPCYYFLLDKNYLVFDVVEDSLVLFKVSFGFLFALSFVLIARMIASMSAYVNDMFAIQISSESDEQPIKLFLEKFFFVNITRQVTLIILSPMFYASQFYHPMPNCMLPRYLETLV